MAGRRPQPIRPVPAILTTASGADDLQSLKEALLALEIQVKAILERVAKLEGP